MLVHAILTDSARLCAVWAEFAFRTVQRPAQPNLRRAQDAKSSVSKSDAHKTHKVGVLNQVGRKRGFRKVVGFPVAGPLFGASTPVRRNVTGTSRGKHDGGIPRPSQPRLPGCDGCISVGDPSSAPIEEKVSWAVLFRKVRVSGGCFQPPAPLEYPSNTPRGSARSVVRQSLRGQRRGVRRAVRVPVEYPWSPPRSSLGSSSLWCP